MLEWKQNTLIISIIYIENDVSKLTHACINAFILRFCFPDLQCSFSCYKSISRKHIFFPSIDMLSPPSFSSNSLASFANRNPLVSLDPKNARAVIWRAMLKSIRCRRSTIIIISRNLKVVFVSYLPFEFLNWTSNFHFCSFVYRCTASNF